VCTLSDTFVLNNLEVDYMLHKNVVAKMSDITKFKLNLEHHTKEQNNIFQSIVFLESFVSCSNTVYIDFFLLDFQYLNDCNVYVICSYVNLRWPIWACNRIIVNQWRLYNMLLWQENCEIKHVNLI